MFIDQIKEGDIEIIANEERTLTEEEAKSFYEAKSQEVFIFLFLSDISSSMLLILL